MMRSFTFRLEETPVKVGDGDHDQVWWSRDPGVIAFMRDARPLRLDGGPDDRKLVVGQDQDEARRVLRLISACLGRELCLLPPRRPEDRHDETRPLVHRVGDYPEGGENVVRARFVLDGRETKLQTGDVMVRETETIAFSRGERPLILSGYTAREDPHRVKLISSFPGARRLISACARLVADEESIPTERRVVTRFQSCPA
jgi:hypothetical protein